MYSYTQALMEDFEKYKDDYKKFKYTNSQLKLASKVLDFDPLTRVLVFDPIATSSARIFIISPSIFNSPDILFISSPNDLVTNLRHMGTVYMVEWKETENINYNLDNYALSLSSILLNLQKHHSTPIDIIGHCIGGNIAIAANILAGNIANSMTLLSTPWDFSFLQKAKKLHDGINLGKEISKMDKIPALYFQILFFLMNPNSFEQKIGYYKNYMNDMNIERFFAVERWQSSGIDLPKSLYNQLMESVIEKNMFLNNEWQINGITIDPSVINTNVALIVGTKDTIAPPESSYSLPLSKAHITKFEYDTGHIGYLVGSQNDKFILELGEWIKNIEVRYERSLHYAC